MLNLLQSIKWVALVIGIFLFAFATYLWLPPTWGVSAFVASLFSGMFFLISFIGFRVEAKVESTIAVGLDIAGESVNKVTDAVVERIKR